MLGKTAPGIWEFPSILECHCIQWGSRISHSGVEICKFAIQTLRQIEGLPHRVEGIVGKSENVVTNHVDAGPLNGFDDVDDILLIQRFLSTIADMLAAGFNTQREPADPGIAEHLQTIGLDRINP